MTFLFARLPVCVEESLLAGTLSKSRFRHRALLRDHLLQALIQRANQALSGRVAPGHAQELAAEDLEGVGPLLVLAQCSPSSVGSKPRILEQKRPTRSDGVRRLLLFDRSSFREKIDDS